MNANVAVGDSVIFTDSYAVEHNALVTAVWGEGNPAINLVYVSGDDNRKDQFGRQTERHTSVCHKSVQQAHGMFWRRLTE